MTAGRIIVIRYEARMLLIYVSNQKAVCLSGPDPSFVCAPGSVRNQI